MNTTLTAETIYRINFTHSNKRFVLSLNYNGSNSFLFINATKIYEFKAKKSEIKDHCNISKDFTFIILLSNIVKESNHRNACH